MIGKGKQTGNYFSTGLKHSLNTVALSLAIMIASVLFYGTVNADGLSGGVAGVGAVAGKVNQLKLNHVSFKEYKVFTLSKVENEDAAKTVRKYTLVNLTNEVSTIINTKPDYIKLTLPVERGAKPLTVLLYKVDISPAGYTLLTSDGRVNPVNNVIVHYRGAVENGGRSVAAFTFAENETMGMVSNADGNYVIGRIGKNLTSPYIIYNDKDLIPAPGIGCGTTKFAPKHTSNERTAAATTTSSKCVNWYWEIDNNIYVDKGSLANVNTYIQGVFNQTSTLYANDGMSTTLGTVYVWTTTSPYTGPATSDYLTQFGNYRTSFTGDLAHLIGYNGGGGIAWIGGFCSTPMYEMAYSGISSTYSNVPTYSWTVECIAHEEGHLFGSQHTHACAWNGNDTKIDDCGGDAGYSEGTCPPEPNPTEPVAGGTIMSYCQLTSTGINLSLGFGPQPAALMLNDENTAACLSSCGGCATPSQPGAITGNTSVCSGSSQTYSISAVTGATSYTWTFPSGWSGASTTSSITVTAGSTAGAVSVTANNSCGAGTAQTLSVAITSAPATPGSISGTTTVCPSSSQVYSISAVTGATSYTWTIPSGWSGSSTTSSISVTSGSTSGSITVKANNTCGSSAVKTLSVTVSSSGPSQPGAITGNTTVCSSSSQTYSVTAVSGATSYTWTIPSGWSGTSTTNTINVTAGSAGGSITVKANSGCGSSAVQTLSVAIGSVAPTQPGTITGSATVCPSSSQTYSITAVNGATSYTWTLPSGWSGSSTTTSISVTSGSAGGSITVKANNSCASSTVQTLSVTISSVAPTQPGAITGNATVCPSSSQTYSISAVSGATSYTWTYPAGWSGSSTTTSITFTTGTTSGVVSVKANNGCGSSTTRTLTVTNGSSAPAKPASVSGNTTVCSGSSQTYSVAAVSGATSYTWTLPSGWSGTSTSTSISVTAGSAGGAITVKANNGCGSSAGEMLTITTTSVPAAPGTIAATGGIVNICPGDSNTYTVSSVSGVTYNWTVPTGATIESGQGTHSIKVIYSGSFTSSGTIQVTGTNSCGTGSASSLAVTRNAPASPATIIGPSQICPDSTIIYSINTVSSATSYLWAVSASATIQSGQNTTSITTRWPAGAGNVTVAASNACGNSGSRSMNIDVDCLTGVETLNSQSFQATVFPNPSAGNVTLKFNSIGADNYSIRLHDITGRQIMTESGKALEGMNNIVLDLSNYSNGIYMLQLQSGQTTQLIKLVLNK